MALLPALAVFSLLLLLTNASDPCSRCRGERTLYVCGYNGNLYQTYDNPCQCECRGYRYTYGVCRDDRGHCPVPHPVCGSDQRTYSSPCAANANGVRVQGWGNCGASVRLCHSGYDYSRYEPVCCTDGHQYYNTYYAQCAHAKVAYVGSCRRDCSCDRGVYGPVCCTDGRTYGNRCYAQCHRATVSYAGQCRPVPATRSSSSCNCGPHNYQSVCASDYNTYHSPCLASCAGVSVLHAGACTSASYRDYPDSRTYRVYSDRDGSLGRTGYRYCDCAHYRGPHVCSDNGVTYDNECLARCANQRVLYVGRCRTAVQPYYSRPECDLRCGSYNDQYPVCCTDGRSYRNACQARCGGAHIFYYGTCETRVYLYRDQGRCRACDRYPRGVVCGNNGRTYYNLCYSYCASTDHSAYRAIGLRSRGFCHNFHYPKPYW